MKNGNDRERGRGCRMSRRELLWESAGGFGAVALPGMLGSEFLAGQALAASGAAPNPLAGRPITPRALGRAKHVIFLFMYGGPSQVDTIAHTPDLYALDGKPLDVPTFGRQGKRAGGRVVGPKWRFRPYGECGKYVSDLFPHVGTQVDKIAFLHSMYAESPIHGSAILNMNCGRLISGHPSLGSWVNYGLGTINDDLPGYVVMLDESGGPISGAKNWTNGYMPASLADGRLAALCPSGLPMPWRAALFGKDQGHQGHHDHHAEHAKPVEASELCEFAATAAVGPTIVIAPLLAQPRRATSVGVQGPWFFSLSPVRGFSARAPPAPA